MGRDCFWMNLSRSAEERPSALEFRSMALKSLEP